MKIINKESFLWWVVILVILVAVSIGTGTCGGRKFTSTSVGSLDASRQKAENTKSPILLRKKVVQVEEVLSELSALGAPEGVDPAIFESLKAEFSRILSARSSGRIVSTPPIGPINRVEDLRVKASEDGGYVLSWSYKNVGDYNQDGTADVADIAKLAEEFLNPVSSENEWVDGNRDGQIDIADIPPLAENFFAECAYYVVEGSANVGGPYYTLGQVDLSEATGSGRKRFTYALDGLVYTNFRVVPYDSSGQPGEPSRDTLSANTLSITGTAKFDTGEVVSGALVNARSQDNFAIDDATTGSDGVFQVELAPPVLPVKIIVEVDYTDLDTNLVLTNFKTITPEAGGDLVLEDIILPNPAGSELAIAGNQATSSSGDIVIYNLAPEISQIFAKSYEPDLNPEAFPGEFADDMGFKLNSSVFLWVVGQDSSGNQVRELSQPATVKLEIPQTQWRDLADIRGGNGRIDVPIYDFDEASGEWVAIDDGWLVDEGGNIFPESAEESITSGSYAGRVFVTFGASHFSYKNVDYPNIYVWTLSRLPREKRNTDVFYEAMKLAETIAKSQKGKDAYAKVNKPGATIDSEYFTNGQPDNAGKKAPEVNTRVMDWNKEEAEPDGRIYRTTINGEYWGRVEGWRQDEFYINEAMWNIYTEGGTERKKKEAIVLMASTVLHEFAHQKQHVKKGEEEETEVGKRLEQDIFGGDVHYWPDEGLVLDGDPVSDEQLDKWLKEETWSSSSNSGGSSLRETRAVGDSGLQLIISTPTSTYNPVDPIWVEVTFRNSGSSAIQVLDKIFTIHYPLRFVITDELGQRVRWFGPYVDMNIHPSSFKTLNPGEETTDQFNLRYDELGNRFRYDLFEPGTYTIKAVYSEYLPPFDPVESNEITITIETGPTTTVSGYVMDEGNVPLMDAKVYLATLNSLYGTTTTDASGYYEFPGVIQGDYVLGFAKQGYQSKMDIISVLPPDPVTKDAQLAINADIALTQPVFDISDPYVDQVVGTASFNGSLNYFNGTEIARALNGSFSLIPFSYQGSGYGTFSDLIILTTGGNGIRFYAANELGFTISQQFVVAWQPPGDILFRATLTWDGSGDMDLHVQDPNNEHCYYSNKTIGTGFLDVDNTTAYGPENFTCIVYEGNQPVPGTYHVWVHYYSGSEPRNCTITLRANIGETYESVVTTGPYLLASGDWYAIDVHVDENGYVTWTIPGTPPPA